MGARRDFLQDLRDIGIGNGRFYQMTFTAVVGSGGVVTAPDGIDVHNEFDFAICGLRGFAQRACPITPPGAGGYNVTAGTNDFDPRNVALVTFKLEENNAERKITGANDMNLESIVHEDLVFPVQYKVGKTVKVLPTFSVASGWVTGTANMRVGVVAWGALVPPA
jgi:hypothetical protein